MEILLTTLRFSCEMDLVFGIRVRKHIIIGCMLKWGSLESCVHILGTERG